MSDLSPEQYSTLKQYHVALKQFLAVSPAPTKPNPARAAKARQKLLNLSPSQFYELSTDVYDELQRRISESQEEPNFLLPMDSFHRKRNEAREKLGSLQQTRFRDLVSDIFYEIERRSTIYVENNNLYNQQPKVQSPNNQRVSTDTVLTATSDGASQDTVRQSVQSKGSDGKVQGIVSLQPTTVIPTKADMAWSSDEEEDHDVVTEQKIPTNEVHVSNEPHLANKANASENTHARSRSLNKASTTSATSPPDHSHGQGPSVLSNYSPRQVPAQRQSIASQTSSTRDTVGEMNGFSPSASRTSLQRGLSLSKNRNKDREIELLLQEGTKMDNKITDLEQKNNLLHTKAEKYEEQVQTLQKHNDNLTAKISKLQTEIETKDQEIKKLESGRLQDTNVSSKITDRDGVEVSDSTWKAKYLTLKDLHQKNTPSLNTISDKALSKYTSTSGLIPLTLATKLRDEIEQYLISLSTVSSDPQNSSSLFDHMSTITDIAGKIVSGVPQSEKAEMVRASLSHAITSTRYYKIYHELLPKLIVESAVSQIAFSVFELIQDVKLTIDNSTDASAASATDRPAPTFEKTSEADVSPVRPLRMAIKSESGSTSPRSVGTTATPRPLNLTINSQLANSLQNSDKKHSSSPLASKSVAATSSEMKTPSKISPLASRYSPEPSMEPTSPLNGLRKSSSGNILSKVKQFEQQADPTPSSSPKSKKQVVSPLSDNAIGLFGKRKVSESGITSRSLTDDTPASTNETNDTTEPVQGVEKAISATKDVEPQISPSTGIAELTSMEFSASEKSPEVHTDDSPLKALTTSKAAPAAALASATGVAAAGASVLMKSVQTESPGKSSAESEESAFSTSPKSTKSDETSQDEGKSPTETLSKATTEPLAIDDNNVWNDKSPVTATLPETSVPQDVKEAHAATSQSTQRQIDEEDFDVDEFDIEDPDNTLTELLLYLEHQTVKVIATIQALLTSIKTADSTKGQLRRGSKDISDVVSQMVDATSNSMNQSRNAQLKEHGRWVVDSLADSKRRMIVLCTKGDDVDDDDEYADKQFKQRLAGIAFDVAKCTKELVKSVEEANLKEEIAHLNARLVH